MLCPQCGYDMENNSKCVRCGYEVKTLAVIDENVNNEKDEPETRVIDPDATYISGGERRTSGGGYSDPFSSIFGDVFDPIGSILGDLFGFSSSPFTDFDVYGEYDDEDEYVDDDVQKKNNAVEVKKVEIYDENGNPVEQESKFKKTVKKVKKKIKDAFDGDKKK